MFFIFTGKTTSFELTFLIHIKTKFRFLSHHRISCAITWKNWHIVWYSSSNYFQIKIYVLSKRRTDSIFRHFVLFKRVDWITILLIPFSNLFFETSTIHISWMREMQRRFNDFENGLLKTMIRFIFLAYEEVLCRDMILLA